MNNENRITIPWMIEHLTSTCKKVYEKEVLFIVPQEPKGLKRHLNKFLKDNPDAVIIDQTDKCYTYQEQRDFVSKVVLTNPATKIIVLTYSAVTLSDAFTCQIYIWRENRFKYLGTLSTFGASPCQIAIAAFLVNESIGTLSDKILHEWLNKEWEKEDLAELNAIVHEIGGGWPRAKLRELLDVLETSLNKEEVETLKKHYGVE